MKRRRANKFFSIIAHDLRSPFTALLGFTDILASKAAELPPEKVQDYAESIDRSGRKVFGLLENLLEWSRVQMDRIAFEPELYDLRSLIQKTNELMSGFAAEKGIGFSAEVPELKVYADAAMVETIVRNLTQNAIKFTSEGGKVSLVAGNSGGKVVVSVSDTGVGMHPDRIAKLFLLGQQTSSTGTAGEPGTGLGLILCKDMVEKNGGTIEVESEFGVGSVFRFTLPAEEP